MLKNVVGSHHQFVHPTKPGKVTVPHPKKDLALGLLKAIGRQAGIMLPLGDFACVIQPRFPEKESSPWRSFRTAQDVRRRQIRGRIEEQAAEALQGWLEAHLLDGEAPPRPSVRSPRVRRGERVLWVEIPLRLAVKLVVRWARQDAGLTQARLAKLAGVSQPVIAKLEAPNSNPTVETLDRVFSVLKVSPEFGMPRHDHA